MVEQFSNTVAISIDNDILREVSRKERRIVVSGMHLSGLSSTKERILRHLPSNHIRISPEEIFDCSIRSGYEEVSSTITRAKQSKACILFIHDYWLEIAGKEPAPKWMQIEKSTSQAIASLLSEFKTIQHQVTAEDARRIFRFRLESAGFSVQRFSDSPVDSVIKTAKFRDTYIPKIIIDSLVDWSNRNPVVAELLRNPTNSTEEMRAITSAFDTWRDALKESHARYDRLLGILGIGSSSLNVVASYLPLVEKVLASAGLTLVSMAFPATLPVLAIMFVAACLGFASSNIKDLPRPLRKSFGKYCESFLSAQHYWSQLTTSKKEVVCYELDKTESLELGTAARELEGLFSRNTETLASEFDAAKITVQLLSEVEDTLSPIREELGRVKAIQEKHGKELIEIDSRVLVLEQRQELIELPAFKGIRDLFSDHSWPEIASTPAWSDVQEERIAEDVRAIDNTILLIRQGKPVLVMAPPKRGKTFLVRSVGFRLDQIGYQVLQANARYINPRIAIEEIRSASKSERSHLFIIEDCHLDPESIGEIVRWVCNHKADNCRFLFTIRGLSPDDLGEPLSSLANDNNIRLELYQPVMTHVHNIVSKFCQAKTPAFPNSVFLNPTDVEIQEFVSGHRIGFDLERLVRFLKAWENECDTIRLDEVPEDMVLRHEWNRLCLNEYGTRNVFCLLAAFGQFEIDTVVGFIEEQGLQNELSDLHSRGLIHYKIAARGQMASLREEEDSIWILSAVSRFHPEFNNEQYVNECVKRYVVWGASNAHRLLEAVSQAKYRSALEEVFRDQHALDATTELMSRQSSTTLLHVLDPINRLFPQFGKYILGKPKVYLVLVGDIKGAAAWRIRRSFRLLSKSVNLHELFVGWSKDDWHSTISVSKVNTLRLMCYDLRLYKLNEVLEQFAQCLTVYDMDQLFSGSSDLSLRQINDLVGNIIGFTTKQTSSALLKALVRADLSKYIQETNSNDLGWLLRIIGENSESQDRVMISKYHSEIDALFERSEVARRFWLLWEIYKADKFLAQSFTENRNPAYWVSNESALSRLACIGLFGECNGDIHDLDIPSSEVIVKCLRDEMVQRKPRVTEIILSLVALTRVWHKEQMVRFCQCVDIGSLRELIQVNPSISTKDHLIKLYDEIRISLTGEIV